MYKKAVYKRAVLSFILVISCFVTSAQADEVLIKNGTGSINWSKGIIYAEGYGVAPADSPSRQKRLLARRAAQVDAYRNLGEMLNGVRVTSETVVREMVAASDVVKTKLDTMIKGATIVEDNYQNEVATVTVAMPLDGSFMKAVTPEIVPDSASTNLLKESKRLLSLFNHSFSVFPKANAQESIPQRLINNIEQLEFAKQLMSILDEGQDSDTIERLTAEINNYENNTSFTGLIVNAKGVPQFEIAAVPRIRNEDGDIIYPKTMNLRASLSAKRPVSYDFDLNDAKNNNRVAYTPMVAEAISTYRSRYSDLVISNEAAERIRNNASVLSRIENAGVMIVISR